MLRAAPAIASLLILLATPLRSPEPSITGRGYYLFAFAGDSASNGNDFLAVIDADPASLTYGRLVTTLATDQRTMRAHHTEYEMPASGMLFANDHDAGRTFIFDLRDPLHPRVAASFDDRAGYTHPHSYARLPNGHVLATFQHAKRELSPGMPTGTMSMDYLGGSGGLVELDDRGRVIRSASSADSTMVGALLTPYSLVVLPGIDRVLTTNSSMSHEDLFRGLTFQLWRLSDLKLLKTEYFDTGRLHFRQLDPEEPRQGPDGSVFVQTVACGLERVTSLDTERPSSRLVYEFPGSACGIPVIVGHYLVETVPTLRGLVVLDITNGAKPVEVSRVRLSDSFAPHWLAWDAKTERIAVTGSEARLYLLKFDPRTGAVSVDKAFRDAEGRPGFDFRARQWPHGWTGSGLPHGAVFSR